MSHNASRDFRVIDTPTRQDMRRLQDAVKNQLRVQTNGEYDQPGVELSLVLKGPRGNVRGGVIASTVFRVMHLEVLWVAEDCRRLGYGGQLVLGAERLGLEMGCMTSQTWTFSFQGPAFYPTIGYEPLGVYDGYPNGITEHVFMKRLHPPRHNSDDIDRSFGAPDARGYILTTDVSDEDKSILHEGLNSHVIAHVGDGHKGISIKLAIKDQDDELIGGLFAWTTLRNLIFEHIWIEEPYRGRGLGRMLILEGERLARESGCIASQASCFSLQAPGFFESVGYKVLGVSSGYPHGVKEFYLIKKYNGS